MITHGLKCSKHGLQFTWTDIPGFAMSSAPTQCGWIEAGGERCLEELQYFVAADPAMVSHNQQRECRECGTTTGVGGYEDPRSTEAYGDSQYPDVWLCTPCVGVINDRRRNGERIEIPQGNGGPLGAAAAVVPDVEHTDASEGESASSGDGTEDRAD